jgi:HlyD family secretion protein|tara:strand:- start:1324 stop:2490 length:1167 start_codon:yes stop_codon:yes gene_type:complete
MTKRRLIIPALLVAAGAAVYAYLELWPARDPNLLPLSGNIEVTDVDVSFQIAGWVAARQVFEGEVIKKGDPIARLDGTALAQEVARQEAGVDAYVAELAALLTGSRPEEIAQAQAAVAQAQARLAELVAGSRPQEITTAKAGVELARADLDRLTAEFERQKELLQRKVTSQQAYDRAKAEFAVATSRLKEAQEKLKLIEEGPRKEQIDHARAVLMEAEQRLALVRKGPRQEEIDRARAHLDQSDQSLALARTRLGYAKIAAPLSGVVLSENVEAGEYILPGVPVVTIGDLVNSRVRAYVNETDLGRIKLGQPVCVTTDSYPDKVYPGKLAFISSQAEFTPKNVQTTKERVKLVYRVKIEIANPDLELKPGMPADAAIWLGAGTPPCLR